MFHPEFTARARLALVPASATDLHSSDFASLHGEVCRALRCRIRIAPPHKVGDDLATVLESIIHGAPDLTLFDHYGLPHHLAAIKPAVAQALYNSILTPETMDFDVLGLSHLAKPFNLADYADPDDPENA